METREQRGLELLSNGKTPLLIDKETFKVPSQSGAGHYKVTHFDAWRCSCADFTNRKVLCKHIHATMFFLKMRNKVELQDFNVEEELQSNRFECKKCFSDKLVKCGKRKTSSGIKQRWQCSACGQKFVLEPLKKVKANAKIIVLCMDLYYKGLSLRDISDTVYQFYGQKIHFDTIRRWITKFSLKMSEYTKRFTPELSGQFHSDEQMIKSKGKWVYAWNTIDHSTRFLLASTLTKGRSVKDAQTHYLQLKDNNPNAIEPKYIITQV